VKNDRCSLAAVADRRGNLWIELAWDEINSSLSAASVVKLCFECDSRRVSFRHQQKSSAPASLRGQSLGSFEQNSPPPGCRAKSQITNSTRAGIIISRSKISAPRSLV